jgi:hypothetical protein
MSTLIQHIESFADFLHAFGEAVGHGRRDRRVAGDEIWRRSKSNPLADAPIGRRYSRCSASTGSTRTARWAGAHAASNAVTSSTSTDAASNAGLCAPIPYTTPESVLPTAKVSAKPATAHADYGKNFAHH